MKLLEEGLLYDGRSILDLDGYNLGNGNANVNDFILRKFLEFIEEMCFEEVDVIHEFFAHDNEILTLIEFALQCVPPQHSDQAHEVILVFLQLVDECINFTRRLFPDCADGVIAQFHSNRHYVLEQGVHAVNFSQFVDLRGNKLTVAPFFRILLHI